MKISNLLETGFNFDIIMYYIYSKIFKNQSQTEYALISKYRINNVKTKKEKINGVLYYIKVLNAAEIREFKEHKDSFVRNQNEYGIYFKNKNKND